MKLGEGEYLVARIKKHWMAIIFPLTVIFFSFPPLFLLVGFFPLLWAGYKIARFLTDEIVVTNKNFYVRVGLFEKEMQGMPLDQISKVDYTQGFLGRKLNYGTLYVYTAATAGGVDYSYIAKPEIVKTSIEQALSAIKTNDEQK